MFSTMKNRKSRKGFSLVELVIVILVIAILAVAVFAGGSVLVKKSQVSRTESDLHNFSIAVESFLNETPKVANSDNTSNDYFPEFINALNANLPEDYKLNSTAVTNSALTAAINNSDGNITVDALADATETNVRIYESIKTDAWDNHYYVILDCGERHGDYNSDFYITVVSAGPDAKTDLAGRIGGESTDINKIDDVFLLAQYENGDVSAVTYNAASDSLQYCSDAEDTLSALAWGTALYNAADSDAAVNCPVNF